MSAYFNTSHLAGLLLLFTISAWGMMELSQRSNVHREGATRIGDIAGRLAFLGCLIAATAVANLTPRVVPAAAIRPAPVAFAAGLVILLAGLVLRGWSFKALGQYFTHTVMVSSDQPVIATGPYRVLRHPSYTGGSSWPASGSAWPPRTGPTWPACCSSSSCPCSGASTWRRTR